jgi:predicted dehydrogenase
MSTFAMIVYRLRGGPGWSVLEVTGVTMDDGTRVGLVGLNQRATRLLLPGLVAAPRARLTAVCSRDLARAQATAARLGAHVRAFDRPESMARSGVVDAVFVNTPAATHHHVCAALIDAGVAVICEKPLAADTAAARDLARHAAAAGVRTAVNFTYRSIAAYRLTERLLAAGTLGRPLHAEIALLQGHDYLPGVPHASAWLDSGVHLFDTLLGLSAAAQAGPVTAVSATPMQREGEPDFGWAFVARTVSGTVVSAAYSRSALGWHNGWRWSFYGERGAITVEADGGRVDARLASPGDGRPQGVWRQVDVPADIQTDEARFPAYHMDRLVGAVRGEEQFPDFAGALATHDLADALAESAATGRWQTVRHA